MLSSPNEASLACCHSLAGDCALSGNASRAAAPKLKLRFLGQSTRSRPCTAQQTQQQLSLLNHSKTPAAGHAQTQATGSYPCSNSNTPAAGPAPAPGDRQQPPLLNRSSAPAAVSAQTHRRIRPYSSYPLQNPFERREKPTSKAAHLQQDLHHDQADGLAEDGAQLEHDAHNVEVQLACKGESAAQNQGQGGQRSGTARTTASLRRPPGKPAAWLDNEAYFRFRPSVPKLAMATPMVTRIMLSMVLQLNLSVLNRQPTVKTATGISACAKTGETTRRASVLPSTRCACVRVSNAAWGPTYGGVACCAHPRPHQATHGPRQAAHLEHLDEGHGEVEVGSVANPQRDRVAGADGNDGPAERGRHALVVQTKCGRVHGRIAAAACCHSRRQRRTGGTAAAGRPHSRQQMCITAARGCARRHHGSRGGLTAHLLTAHLMYVSRSMLIACTLPLFTRPVASAAQKNMCLHAMGATSRPDSQPDVRC